MLNFIFLLCLIIKFCKSNENEHVYKIVEELPMKHLIGNFHSIIPSFQRQLYRYKILAREQEIKNIFEINEIEGDLRTKIKIDRDTLCAEKNLCCKKKFTMECELTFIVIVTNDKSELNSKYFRVRVIIEDINDNIPRFQNNVQRMEISEMATIGTTFKFPSAIDNDIGKNSIQLYTLEGDTSVLRLIMASNSEEIEPRLEIINQLDRETVPRYSLNLCAQDGGRPVHKGCIRIELIITDANDNVPIINERSLVYRIPKNFAQLEKIGTIKAIDKDESNNALLRYYVSELAPLSIRSKISIDATTGDIRSIQKFNYDSIRTQLPQIIIPIIVIDAGVPPLSATATVTIHLEDANDESPVITVTDLRGKIPPRPQIMENKLPGQIAAFVHAVDADQGSNGQIDCNLLESSYFRLVLESGQRDTNEKEYKIESTQSLDRETKSSLDLVLICKDKGTPSKTSTQTIVITILDENDNYPVFHPNPVMISIMENRPVNSMIVQLNITDADYSSSGRAHVTCNLESDENEYITIDQNSCTLLTRKVIDREVNSKILIQVVARDKGLPPKQTVAQVIIQVLDENDNKPEFHRKLLEYRIKENQDPTIVAKLVAQDPDDGKNGEVTYQLSFHDNVAHTAFGIDLVSGNLYTKIRLDREKRSSYEFEVIAIDNGKIRLASSATVKVNIDDVNDNNPKFIYPSRENRSHSYSLYNVKGTPLIKITATDSDEGLNKDIIYEIINGNHNGVFQLDPSSGQLFLARDLHVSDAGTYTLKIEARDNGDPSLKDIGVLRITFDSRSKIIQTVDRNRGLNHKFRSDTDEPGSLILGRNIILVICVIFVALLAVLVFLVMLYFMKKKQILNTQLDEETAEEIGRKCDPALLAALNHEHINITNNNLWNHGLNTLQLNSLGKQQDQYLPLSPTHSIQGKDLTNNYQRLIRRNENVMMHMSPISLEQDFKDAANDCSLFFTNSKSRARENDNSVLILNTPGSLSIKNRNTSSSIENSRQGSLPRDMATNDHILSSSFV